MQKDGIVAYLYELGRRYGELAKDCKDRRVQFELNSLAMEISDKASGLAEAFVVERYVVPRQRRQQQVHSN
jgi:hypothetical protein